jgi:hypothetical protein
MKPIYTICLLPQIQVRAVDEDGGAFALRSPVDRRVLTVVASNGLDWDHVSVSRADRVPTWFEMEYVKRLFFTDDEVVMQLHVAVAQHIDIHPNCLHLWKPQATTIPLPPSLMV